MAQQDVIDKIGGIVSQNKAECDFQNMQIKSLVFMEHLQMGNITSLNISAVKIQNLQGIQAISNLITLNVSYNQIDSLENINALPKLQTLNASFNFIDNLTPVTNLKCLKSLHVSNNKINQLQQLDCLIEVPTLESLTIFELPNNDFAGNEQYSHNQIIFKKDQLMNYLVEKYPKIQINKSISKLPDHLKDLILNITNMHFKGQDFEYEGKATNLIPNGEGKISVNKKNITKQFEGVFQYGYMKSGIEITNEYQYQGQFNQKGQKQGQGILKKPNQYIYEGNFENDIQQGRGICYYLQEAQNSLYDGEWANNQRNGTGSLYDTDGSVFAGQWKNDVANGYGTYEGIDGTKEEGNWLNNQIVE